MSYRQVQHVETSEELFCDFCNSRINNLVDPYTCIFRKEYPRGLHLHKDCVYAMYLTAAKPQQGIKLAGSKGVLITK